MTGTSAACLHINQSRLYLNHLVFIFAIPCCFISRQSYDIVLNIKYEAR
jgi:hypothetical protein